MLHSSVCGCMLCCRPLTLNALSLVVVPLSIMSNWEKQIEDHVRPGALTSCVYYGKTRSMTPAELKKYDVVITTFSTLSSEYSKQSRSTQCDEESGDSEIEILGDNSGPPPKKAGKRKRVGTGQEITSALQSVYWFRVVLDEAQ